MRAIFNFREKKLDNDLQVWNKEIKHQKKGD